MKNSDMPAMPMSREMSERFEKGFFDAGAGLTKREEMAGRLMHAIVGRSDSPAPRWEECARDAVRAADALLSELEKHQ